MNKKVFRIINVLILCLGMIIFLSLTNEPQDEYKVEVPWVKTKDLSLIPQIVKDNLSRTDGLLRNLFNDLTTDLQLKCDLNNNERKYYIAPGSSILQNETDEFECLDYIKYSGYAAAYFNICLPETNYTKCWLWFGEYKFKSEHDLFINIYQSDTYDNQYLSKVSDRAIFYHDQKLVHGYVPWPNFVEKAHSSTNENQELLINLIDKNDGNPVLYKDLFYDYPRNAIHYYSSCGCNANPPLKNIYWDKLKFEKYSF